MATLTDSPEYTANEIYEIAGTDLVQGAESGAAFSGVGIDNYPHQQLANRTAFLKARQDVNITNIAALQAWKARFVGSLQQNGYIEIGIKDVSRGDATAILQWGFAQIATTDFDEDDLSEAQAEAGHTTTGSVLPGFSWWGSYYAASSAITFPIPFPNAILLPPMGMLSGSWSWETWPRAWPWWWPFSAVCVDYSKTGCRFAVTANWWWPDPDAGASGPLGDNRAPIGGGSGPYLGVTWWAVGF